MRPPVARTTGIADPGEGDKLVAPSAERNADAITGVLAGVAPAQGRALELASGTGQHIVRYAERLPGLSWQPSEVNPERHASIAAYVRESGLDNIAPVIELDALAPGWGAVRSGQNLIVLVNLLHLISADEARLLITEAATALAPEGVFFIYGPFMRDGALTSDADVQFHAHLQAQDPLVGYKNVADIEHWLRTAGLEPDPAPQEMPSNNLVFVARKT